MLSMSLNDGLGSRRQVALHNVGLGIEDRMERFSKPHRGNAARLSASGQRHVRKCLVEATFRNESNEGDP
jgi:hypothetical protein